MFDLKELESFASEVRRVRNTTAKSYSNRSMIPDFLFENMQDCMKCMERVEDMLQKQISLLRKKEEERNNLLVQQNQAQEKVKSIQDLMEVVKKESSFIIARNKSSETSSDLWNALTIQDQAEKTLKEIQDLSNRFDSLFAR